MAELIPNDKKLTKSLEGKEVIRKVCNSKKVNLEKVKRENNLIPMVNQSTSKGVDSSVIKFITDFIDSRWLESRLQITSVG